MRERERKDKDRKREKEKERGINTEIKHEPYLSFTFIDQENSGYSSDRIEGQYVPKIEFVKQYCQSNFLLSEFRMISTINVFCFI